MHQFLKIPLVALALLASTTVPVAAAAAAADTLPVVASFSILGDLVSVIGGERVSVTTLVGPDEDAHMFSPSPADAKKVAQSKLVVVNGLGFDSWLNRLSGAAGYTGATVVASSGIKARDMSDVGQIHADPHAWQDPTNVIIYVGNIAAALGKIDPAGAHFYQDNRDRYVKSLKELDAWGSQQFAQIPAAKRKVLTSHDAFGYLGARYQITFLAPQGTSTESEASAKDVANLITQIRRERIKSVHVENMSNPKLLQQLSHEAGVTMGAKLYADALSGPQDGAPTYLKMMRYNITQLMSGLKLN